MKTHSNRLYKNFLTRTYRLSASLAYSVLTVSRAGMMTTHVNHQTHLIHSRNPSINSKSAIIFLAPAVMTCNVTVSQQIYQQQVHFFPYKSHVILRYISVGLFVIKLVTLYLLYFHFYSLAVTSRPCFLD